VTKDLLLHWIRPDRSRRLFFCQREAVETLIYLLELAIPGRLRSTGFQQFELDAQDLDRLLRGEKPGFDLPERQQDYYPRLVDTPDEAGLLPLRRLGCKMATGSGKTIVMAMLIAWAFCNRGRNPATTLFPNGVLVCAPNLTVRNRIQVLRPETPENLYDAFDLVPAKYRELLGAGKVLIVNWHVFAPKSPHREGDTSYRVVDKGEETLDAFTKDRLGEFGCPPANPCPQ
jgi:type III restriction enzyme